MIDVDYAAAKRALINQAAGHVDGYKYTQPEGSSACHYAHKDAEGNLTIKGCIVGSAAIDEEWCDFDFFNHPDEDDATYPLNTSTSYRLCQRLTKEGKARFTDKAREFLRTVQTKQDTGTSWSHAVLYSISEYDTYDFLTDTFENSDSE